METLPPQLGQKVEVMKNLLPILFAPILLGLFSFASPQGGDVGVGTLPVTRPGFTDSVSTSTSADELPSMLVVHRTLTGAPGTTITAQRGNVLLVASSGEWGGTQDAVQPPTVMVVKWTSGGIQFEMTITQGPNEPLPDFTRRVDATVRAFTGPGGPRPRDGDATGSGNHP